MQGKIVTKEDIEAWNVPVGYSIKRFKIPELKNDEMQLAFKMLIAGVGFYRKKQEREPAIYHVFSHHGDEIGKISCNLVNQLIHDLSANYQGCLNRRDAVSCYDRIFSWGKGEIRHLESITFGWGGFGHYAHALMQYFERNPISIVVGAN